MQIDRRTLAFGAISVGVLAAGGYYLYTENQLDQRYGVVELGSGGAKWSVIAFQRAQLERTASRGPQAAETGVRLSRYRRVELEAGDFPIDVRDPSKQDEVVQAVRDAIEAVAHHGADGRYVVVGSSSISSVEGWDALKAKLQQLVFERTRRDFVAVTVEQEVEYLFRWVIPNEDRERSSVIDVGSGNIKGAHLVAGGNNRFDHLQINDGVSTIAREARGRVQGDDIAQALSEKCENTLAQTFRSREGQGLIQPITYIAGGACWAMTSVIHPLEIENNESWVQVTADDIARYHALVFHDPSLESVLASYAPGSTEWQRISDVKRAFENPDRILAGAEILRTLSRELDFDGNREHWIYFTKDGQFAWSTMHLLSELRLEQMA